MSNSDAKRKVMSRIDLAAETSSGSTRFSNSLASKSPPKAANGFRKGSSGHVRAKVDMSAFASGSPQMYSPTITSDTAAISPPSNQQQQQQQQQQQYFNRPKRPISTSYTSSPFLSPGLSSSLSISPSLSTKSGTFASTSSLASTSQNARVVRSPSPVHQPQRNSPAISYEVHSPSINGPVKVPRDRTSAAAPPISHARVNSVQISSPAVGGGEVGVIRGHARANSSASSLTQGSSYGRRSGNEIVYTMTSSPSIIADRSRSPSPNELKLKRRISQSSTSSSTVSASTSRQAAMIPLARAQQQQQQQQHRVPPLNTRPSLNMAWSMHNNNYSPTEMQPPASASSSFASSSARMPSFKESNLEETSSNSISLQTPLQSPLLELDAEAQEAKKSRKILDLEITNKSLMAINSGLEVVKLKHAQEIKELKKRIREGRTLETSIGLDAEEEEEDGALGDDSNCFEEDETLDTELEMAHARCKSLIDGMVNQAREAILYKYEMDPKNKGSSRVLHPAEVEMMQDGSGEGLGEAMANSLFIVEPPSSS